MLKLNGFSAGYSGQEVKFLGSTGQGILHAYKNYDGELVILFCNVRIEKSWYHVSNKIALKAWHRARRITKIPISYTDFVKKFGEVRDAYNYNKVFGEKGFLIQRKSDAIYVYKESEFVNAVGDRLTPAGECQKIDGYWVPIKELDEWTSVCDECGERHMKAHMTDVHLDGDEIKCMCHSCRDAKAFQCKDCNEWYVNSLLSELSRVCKHCRETKYLRCPECGRLFRRGYGHPLEGHVICDGCYREIKSIVRSYHDNPDLNFLGSGNKFIGTEIETVGRNEDEYIQRIKFTNKFGEEESTLYQMQDGSLNSYGIENITMPMSKEYFDQFNFEDWFKGMSDRGASTDSSCGLHVHLSREWMDTDEREEQDLLVGRMRQFLADNMENVQKFARRKDDYWCRFKKSFDKSDKPDTKEERASKHKQNAQSKDSRARYTSVNNNNEKTIEFRIFAGTLQPRTYRASVEFCLRVVDYIKTHEENTETWQEFIAYKPLPESMKKYMESIGMETSFAVQQELEIVEQ